MEIMHNILFGSFTAVLVAIVIFAYYCIVRQVLLIIGDKSYSLLAKLLCLLLAIGCGVFVVWVMYIVVTILMPLTITY